METTFQQLIEASPRLITLLEIIRALQLKDCWLCAGTLRNYYWNLKSGKAELFDSNDVDVIFFDPNVSYEMTCRIEAKLKAWYPQYAWELKNQVYMHGHNADTKPYQNAADALAKFPETCTALACRLQENGRVEVLAPHGLQDLFAFYVQPTPHFKAHPKRLAKYQERVQQKRWQEKWPQLVIN